MKKILFALSALLTISCNNDWATIDPPVNDAEQSEINRLYAEAKSEGNEITVWGGGDAPDQLDWIKNEWEKDFPDIKINIRVDLSKFLDVEIDEQLANNNLTPDIVHLQTIHDFYRWKSQDALENFKPIQWDVIPDDIKDADGAFTPVYMISFAMLVNRSQTTQTPTSYTDLLNPEYKNSLILNYPHDDDATLFLYKKIVDQYGWSYIDNLIAQNPRWIRGTAAPVSQVQKGNYRATMGAAGIFDASQDGGAQVVLPSTDHFLTWAQTAAIFKQTKHKKAAQLYMTWLLSKKMQTLWVEWSPRTDISPKPGYIQYQNYPNTSPKEFIDFMLDRNSLNIFSTQLEEKIGAVQGGSPLTDPDILDLL